MDFSAKHQEFESLKARVAQLESELNDGGVQPHWQPGGSGYYWAYHLTSGFLLGLLGAAAALLVNVVLAPMAGKHPLELIRVFLTFPLGADALSLADPVKQIPTVRDGMILAFGCCLYLGTGLMIGMPFHVAMTRFVPDSSLANRLIVATVLSLAIWLIGFYGILIWLQPALFGGSWITNGQHLPWWVAAGTHLVFGWTMALLAPLAKLVPYEPPSELPAGVQDDAVEPGG